MTHKYHCADINPLSVRNTLTGHSFCCSMAYPKTAQWALDQGHGNKVMLDSGAFTAWTRGKPVIWSDYYKWLEGCLKFDNAWAVIGDVIDGTEEENDRLVEEWPFGTRGVPVWHLHESFDRLMELAKSWPKICFGSSGIYHTVGNQDWHKRVSEAFDIITVDEIPITKVHMLRGLKCLKYKYPFDSVDSANIARNHARQTKKYGETALDRAKRFDMMDCPPRWIRG